MTEDDGEGQVFEKEIKAAIRDTGVLLEYLGRAPSSRLQSQFKDTRERAGSSTVMSIAPPCEDYSEFLNRLTEIRSRYAERSKIAEEKERGDSGLSNKAFLFWSRDFLSGLAAPATAETIRITNAFVECRFPKDSANNSDKLPDNFDDGYSRIACNLVQAVKHTQAIVIIATLITLSLSMYTLSGHQIVAARNDALERYNNVNKKIGELESNAVDHGGVIVERLIDYVKDHPGFQQAGNVNPSGDNVILCDNLVIVSVLPTEKSKFNGSPLQFDACQERLRTRLQLFAIAGQLIAWQRTLTNPLQSLFGYHPSTVNQEGMEKPENSSGDTQAKVSTPTVSGASLVEPTNVPVTIDQNQAPFKKETSVKRNVTVVLSQSEQWGEIAGLLESVAAAPSELFGRSYAVDQEFSQNKSTCRDFGGDATEPGEPCAIRLAEKVEYYGIIPDSIISCLTLYILPCLYGFLGASVLTLRLLRNNVDNFLVRLTDRATIIQNGILGLIAGSVVGLFATYFTATAQSSGSLSISGIAFLAGYNIPRLFSFLDGLSGRVFPTNEPRTAPRTGTS